MLFPIIIVLLVILALLWFARSRALFRISIDGGKQTVVRGYVPSGLLNDFSSVVRHVQRGEIRAHKASGHARLSFSGIDDGVAQRLRNVFGLYPLARLRGQRYARRPGSAP